MIEKVTVIDKVEILETGHVQVRRATYAVEDGVRVGLLGYHRVAYDPGADISREEEPVQAHAAVAWTPEAVTAHRARLDAQTAAKADA